MERAAVYRPWSGVWTDPLRGPQGDPALRTLDLQTPSLQSWEKYLTVQGTGVSALSGTLVNKVIPQGSEPSLTNFKLLLSQLHHTHNPLDCCC